MKPSIWILLVTLLCSSFIISEANPAVKQSAFRLYTTDSDPNTLYLTTRLEDDSSSEESSEENGIKGDFSDESIEDNNVEGHSSEEMGLHRHLMRHDDFHLPENPNHFTDLKAMHFQQFPHHF